MNAEEFVEALQAAVEARVGIELWFDSEVWQAARERGETFLEHCAKVLKRA